MKRLIRLEMKRQRTATIERIRDKEGLAVSYFGLKGKKKRCPIQRVRDEDGVVVEKRKDVLVLAMHW